MEYIDESARIVRERLTEHIWAASISDHANIIGHHTSMDIFSTVGNESHKLVLAINKAMHLRIDDPSLKETIEIPVAHHSAPQCTWLTPQAWPWYRGLTLCAIISLGRYGGWDCIIKLASHTLASGVPHCIAERVICGKQKYW